MCALWLGDSGTPMLSHPDSLIANALTFHPSVCVCGICNSRGCFYENDVGEEGVGL